MSTPGFFEGGEDRQPVILEHKHLQVEIDMGYEELEEVLARQEALDT